MTAYIANARMYAVAPGASAAWKALFAWLAERSGVALDIIDHAYPATLDSLWDRGDLGAAFMCGWPFARRPAKPRLVAAPIPAAPRYGGRPIYFTDLVVRADRPFHSLEDTFGQRVGYTATGSHSGFNALRHHLASRYAGRQGLYPDWVGPLTTPRRVVEALLAGDIDVGPLDSYAHDLLRRHEPQLMAGLRLVDSTVATPIPAMIASSQTPDDVVAALRDGLLDVGSAAELADLRDSLCLAGFGVTQPGDYAVTESRAAEAAGYVDVGSFARPG
jgi:ABC-type phosphate/phosphonate transport system substrate-binding protein